MSRHHHAHGQDRPVAHDAPGESGASRARKHDGAHAAHTLADSWRKHPQRCLDAELSLLPLWRQARGVR